jgi:hypothetical protein
VKGVEKMTRSDFGADAQDGKASAWGAIKYNMRRAAYAITKYDIFYFFAE